jgi:hypothetical protein
MTTGSEHRSQESGRISVIDEEYRDLLARPGKLEAKVFAPRRR